MLGDLLGDSASHLVLVDLTVSSDDLGLEKGTRLLAMEFRDWNMVPFEVPRIVVEWNQRKKAIWPVGFGLVVIDAVEVAVGGVRVFERPQACVDVRA